MLIHWTLWYFVFFLPIPAYTVTALLHHVATHFLRSHTHNNAISQICASFWWLSAPSSGNQLLKYVWGLGHSDILFLTLSPGLDHHRTTWRQWWRLQLLLPFLKVFLTSILSPCRLLKTHWKRISFRSSVERDVPSRPTSPSQQRQQQQTTLTLLFIWINYIEIF